MDTSLRIVSVFVCENMWFSIISCLFHLVFIRPQCLAASVSHSLHFASGSEHDMNVQFFTCQKNAPAADFNQNHVLVRMNTAQVDTIDAHIHGNHTVIIHCASLIPAAVSGHLGKLETSRTQTVTDKFVLRSLYPSSLIKRSDHRQFAWHDLLCCVHKSCFCLSKLCLWNHSKSTDWLIVASSSKRLAYDYSNFRQWQVGMSIGVTSLKTSQILMVAGKQTAGWEVCWWADSQVMCSRIKKQSCLITTNHVYFSFSYLSVVLAGDRNL